jgi:hypothetical protein
MSGRGNSKLKVSFESFSFSAGGAMRPNLKNLEFFTFREFCPVSSFRKGKINKNFFEKLKQNCYFS